jgi:ABC-type transport system substrate-binding protein
MTAQDVEYSFTRSLSPKLKSPVALTYMGDIVGSDEVANGTATELSGLKVIDPSTVSITIKKPKAYWIYTLTYPTDYIVSKAEADKAGGEMKPDDVENGAGTGAFRLVRYDPDQKVTLTANPRYWGGAPKIAGQERLIVRDAGTRHSLYVDGKLDLVDESQANLEADSQDPSLKNQIHFWKRAATWYLNMNEKLVPAFKDVRVRQALAYATDKAKLVQVAYGGHVDAAEDLLPEGIPGYDPNFKGIPYDPAKAKELLAAAGFPGGKGFPTLTMNYRQSDPAIEKTVDLLRQMWSDNLGVTIQGQRTQWSVLIDDENKGNLQTWYIRWAADYLDQQDYYSVLLHSGVEENHSGYSNPKYDALCDAADVEQDATKRSALYRQAARIAADEVPVIPLLYQTDTELIKPNVKGIDDSLMGHLPYRHLSLK